MAKGGCAYTVNGKTYNENEFKAYLLDGGLDSFVSEGVEIKGYSVKKGRKKEESKKTPTKEDLSKQLKDLLGGKPLKLEGVYAGKKVSFEEIGLAEGDTIEQAIDKLIAYDGAYTTIFQAIKADPNLSNVKLELVKSLDGNERGLYYPQGNEKAGLLQIADKQNVYYTAAHELLHFFTLDSKAAEQVKDTPAYKALEDLYNFISTKKEKPISALGNVSMKNYGLTDVKEFMAEMFINPEFREYVSDVFAESKEEIFKQSQYIKDSKKGATIIDVIADLFKELFSKLFSGKDSDIPFDEQQSVIDNAVKIATDLFFGNDVTLSQAATDSGGKLLSISESKVAALSLPSEIDPIINQFVKSSFEQGATESDIKESLVDNGLTEEEANSYIKGYKTEKAKDEIKQKKKAAIDLRKALKDIDVYARAGLDRGQVEEIFKTKDNLTPDIQKLIDDVYGKMEQKEGTQQNKQAKDRKAVEEGKKILDDVFSKISKGQKIPRTFVRITQSEATDLAPYLQEKYGSYKAVSLDQLERIADDIIDIFGLDNAREMISKLDIDERPIAMAKVAMKLREEGRPEEAAQVMADLIQTGTATGRAVKSFDRVRDIIGSVNDPTFRTEFQKAMYEKIQAERRAVEAEFELQSQEFKDKVSGLEKQLHEKTIEENKSVFSKLIDKICNLRKRK